MAELNVVFSFFSTGFCFLLFPELDDDPAGLFEVAVGEDDILFKLLSI